MKRLTSFFSKRILLEKEYNLYTFDFDIQKIIFESKGIKNFIYKNLEKLHPRFSTQCKWKKYFSIKNKKIQLNVIVVDKFLLAQKIDLGAKSIYIKSPLKKIYSSSRRTLVCTILFTFFLILGCTISLMEGTKENQLNDNLQIEKKEVVTEVNELPVLKNIDLERFFQDFISFDDNSDLFLEEVDVEFIGNQKSINFTLRGELYENLEKKFYEILESYSKNEKNYNTENIFFEIKSTFYEKNEGKPLPVVNGKIIQNFSNGNELVDNEDIEGFYYGKERMIDFRNHLINCNVFPEEEGLENLQILFKIEKENVENVFNSYFGEKEFILKGIKVSSSYNDSFMIFNLEFLKESKSLLESVKAKEILTESLFNLMKKEKEKAIPEPYVKMDNTNKKNTEIIIGKIKTSDGVEQILTKTSDGKILLKKEF